MLSDGSAHERWLPSPFSHRNGPALRPRICNLLKAPKVSLRINDSWRSCRDAPSRQQVLLPRAVPVIAEVPIGVDKPVPEHTPVINGRWTNAAPAGCWFRLGASKVMSQCITTTRQGQNSTSEPAPPCRPGEAVSIGDSPLRSTVDAELQLVETCAFAADGRTRPAIIRRTVRSSLSSCCPAPAG